MKVAVGDADGDGFQEVAASTYLAGVQLLNMSGDQVWFFAANPTEFFTGFRDMVMVDLDGDGGVEVVAISDDGFAYALKTPG